LPLWPNAKDLLKDAPTTEYKDLVNGTWIGDIDLKFIASWN
jgi:hypothetical protein